MDKRKLIIAASVLGVLLIAIVTVAIIRAVTPQKADPYVMNNGSNQTSSTSDEAVSEPETTSENNTTKPADESKEADSESATSIDPATVGTVDIAPLSITVSYIKGVGGFEYEVLRTPSGSQYAEFSSAELVGTKCTDDKGAFASILADPSEGEGSTITKTTTVDGTKYGLSLAATNCTSDAAKLQKYQQSFNDAFSLLKKTN